MDAIECIFTRRSIRKYTGEPISDEQLHAMLRAGFSAPSAANLRPWHFIVIKSRVTLAAIAREHQYGKMLPNAACAILVCGDSGRNASEYFLAEDCSAAIENMLLAAHALGLGAVWLGVHPRDERVKAMRRVLWIPEEILPVGIVSVGVPAETREAPDRYDGSMVHMEGW